MQAENITATELFAGEGDVRALCRELDWASSTLGPVDRWSPALRVAVQAVLGVGLPHVLLWGRELIQIYNDAYARLIRAKHPAALGRGNLEIWPEVAHINAPIYERVFTGETVTFEDALYRLERGGRIEDVYLTISYSPIRDETGAIVAVLAAMLETTQDVAFRGLQAEREKLLHDLEIERNRLVQAISQTERARRDAEEAHAIADIFFDAAPVPAGLVDVELRFRRVNRSWADFYGLPPEQVIGRTVAELAPGYVERVEPFYRRVLETGRPVLNLEVVLPRHTEPSDLRHFLVSYFPVGVPRAMK
jgi:PAS domain-containing protein